MLVLRRLCPRAKCNMHCICKHVYGRGLDRHNNGFLRGEFGEVQTGAQNRTVEELKHLYYLALVLCYFYVSHKIVGLPVRIFLIKILIIITHGTRQVRTT